MQCRGRVDVRLGSRAASRAPRLPRRARRQLLNHWSQTAAAPSLQLRNNRSHHTRRGFPVHPGNQPTIRFHMRCSAGAMAELAFAFAQALFDRKREGLVIGRAHILEGIGIADDALSADQCAAI
ncbi:hypothetical protein D3C71_937980 [compost metagenome]